MKPEKTQDRYLIREAEAGLADVYVAANKPNNAEVHFQKAMATIEAARSSVRREDLRLSYLSGVAGFYDNYIDFLVSQRRPEDALQVAEVSRARTLAEGLGFRSYPLIFRSRTFVPNKLLNNQVRLCFHTG